LGFLGKFFKKSTSEIKNSESKFLPKKKLAIEERFVLNFIENGGKFLYCENLIEVKENYDLILEENNWDVNDIFINNPEIKIKYNLDFPFNLEIDNAKCFITDCENLIASDGSILISSNQIHEKKLSEFPENLIIISETKKLKNNISEGLSNIKSKSLNIPTNITTIKNFNKSKKNKDFLSYGTSSKNLYLILLENGLN
tara:strand:+ start:1412 stop:2008 length:597 start_codon:yes stop_codon:yes gene_type:complete